MGVVGRLDQYASMLAWEFDETTANTPSITGFGTYYASEFNENVGIATTMFANVFAPYDPVYDEFGGTLFGAGQGRYMRQNTDKSVIVYNEIDEVSDFRDIVRSGMVLDLDAGMNSSFNNTGTTWYDLTVYGNNGTLIGGPTYSSANNGILTFNNVSTYATVNSNASILSNTAYTKISWFNTNSLSAANNIISGGVSGQHAFWLGSTNTLRAGHNSIWDTVVSSTTLSTNTWYCGAVTFNTTTGWVLYLNGSVVDTDVSTTTFTGNGEILICAFTLGGNLFSGSIATASVYNRVLSASEILQNYNALKHRFGL
jgi:hypothetical protein